MFSFSRGASSSTFPVIPVLFSVDEELEISNLG